MRFKYDPDDPNYPLHISFPDNEVEKGLAFLTKLSYLFGKDDQRDMMESIARIEQQRGVKYDS